MQAKIEASPSLKAASKIAIVEMKKVLQRLHVTGAQDRGEKRRETAPFARLLGKASHANPLEVCKALVHQVLSQALAWMLGIRLGLPASEMKCIYGSSRKQQVWLMSILLRMQAACHLMPAHSADKSDKEAFLLLESIF